MDPLTPSEPPAWVPVRVRTRGSEPLVDWALVERPFREPFFEQTADRAMRHPFNLAFGRTSRLADLATSCASEPAGFVFHMSRCGSTLVAQMLAAASAALVISEAQPLDAVLRSAGNGVDERRAEAHLRGMLGALAGPPAVPSEGRGAIPRRVVVKWHAWHVLHLPLIARAFPRVPWAFVFREPRAVLRSQERARGAELIAGTIDPAFVRLDPAAAAASPPDEYGARVVAALCEAALHHPKSSPQIFVDYDHLADGVEVLAEAFGISLSAADRARAADAARLDTKGSGAPFRSPANEHVSARTDELAARWLDDAYGRLRARRAARAGAS